MSEKEGDVFNGGVTTSGKGAESERVRVCRKCFSSEGL